MKNIVILISGRGSNMEAIVNACQREGWPARIAAVISNKASASGLQFAVTEIAARFAADTGRKVTLNFGSSGNFARQIQQGAPFELFMSADEAFVFRLADAGLTRDRGELYAIGRIVLFVPRGSPLQLDAELKGVQAGWSQVRKFAIANPEHAPYGRAAAEALRRYLALAPDAGDAAFDLGVGEQAFDASAQRFGAELGFYPEKGGSEDDGKDADAPEGKAKNAGHRDGHSSWLAALTGQQKARWNYFHRAKSAVWTR